ncbi:MAG: hypothetical protein Q7J35_01925 [Candidatus Methanoperedens sp.]|nr:hypothetical protein [Candidatus Methanoperedens sp.]
MALKIGISSRSPEDYEKLEIDGQKLEVMRGKIEEEKAVEIKELLESLNEEISGYIDEPCQVTMEINGATSYQGGGGLKALIFDISGNIEKSSGIKIVLNFKINPKK